MDHTLPPCMCPRLPSIGGSGRDSHWGTWRTSHYSHECMRRGEVFPVGSSLSSTPPGKGGPRSEDQVESRLTHPNLLMPMMIQHVVDLADKKKVIGGSQAPPCTSHPLPNLPRNAETLPPSGSGQLGGCTHLLRLSCRRLISPYLLRKCTTYMQWAASRLISDRPAQ